MDHRKRLGNDLGLRVDLDDMTVEVTDETVFLTKLLHGIDAKRGKHNLVEIAKRVLATHEPAAPPEPPPPAPPPPPEPPPPPSMSQRVRI